MPKLNPNVIGRNKETIQQAALKLFCSQGFHGTTIRQIAQRSGISTGNLYNYYQTKEQLLNAIIAKYHAVMLRERNRLLDGITDPFDPEQWRQLAVAIRDVIESHGDYWRLMYIDVTEFENRHFRTSFASLLSDFRNRFERGAWPVRGDDLYRGVDPCIAFGAMWMQIFNYFLVEKLFRAEHHFGVPDAKFIEALCKLYLGGGRSRNHGPNTRRKGTEDG